MNSYNSKNIGKLLLFFSMQGLSLLIINLLLRNSAEGAISIADRLIFGYETFNNGIFLLPIPLILLIWRNRYDKLIDKIIRKGSRLQIVKDSVKNCFLYSFLFSIEYFLITTLIGLNDQYFINWNKDSSLFFSLEGYLYQGQFLEVLAYTAISYFLILFITLLLFDIVYLILDKYFFSWLMIIYLVVWDLFMPVRYSLLYRRLHINYSFYTGDESFKVRMMYALVIVIIIIILNRIIGLKKDFIESFE